MIKILAMIISWSIKNLRKILKIFTGKHVKIGIFLKSLFLGISLIKKFKTFTIVRLIIQGLALANLLFSIFIIISFSDIDFSSINIPPLTQLISIIFGILPFFFTDSAYYIYYLIKGNVKFYLNNIIENITYNTVASDIIDNLNNTIEASNELFLNNKFRNTNSVPPYLLDNIKKTIDRNNFIIENYRKIPRIFYTNNDNKNYEILLDLNTHLEKELERFNSSTSTSASFSINKDISNIDLTPKVSNIDLTPRAPNIEPKFLNPDYFATPKVSNLTEYPPIPKTNEGFPEMESVTNKVVTLPEDQPVSLPKKE